VRQPFEWDPYSDQPKIILDKAYKRSMRLRHWPDYLKMAAISAALMPAALMHMALVKPRNLKKNLIDVIGLGVSPDRGSEQFDLIDELGVKHVLIRMPLWDMNNLSLYYSFAQEFHKRQKTVLINVLQDREHIENEELLHFDIRRIFDTFGTISHDYQIGNAINRVKWGIFSASEYLRFFETVQKVRDKDYKHLMLLGPSVIDFEYHFTCRALFNSFNIHFDRLSALLYVDRNGAPGNKQYGLFDTRRKMRLLGSLASLSHKVRNKKLYITEVNWPLAGTAPYAPTSEKECIAERDYAIYMRDYLITASKTECIDRVYWHQLIASGYGLVDNRNGILRKTEMFNELRQLLASARKPFPAL
jgi:hypothetical protein